MLLLQFLFREVKTVFAQTGEAEAVALQDIMARYDLKPEEILVVDDMKLACRMANPLGIKVAYAGWNGLGIPEIEEEMKQLCDYSFSTVSELAQHLFEEDAK